MPCSRRSFLTSLGALSLPAWFPRLAFAAQPEERAAARDVLVCVFQRGGADGLNIVVPHAESAYHDARPTLGLPDPGARNCRNGVNRPGRLLRPPPPPAPLKRPLDRRGARGRHAVGS